jgi:DNA adenine methylase
LASDLNSDLINTYEVVRDDFEKLKIVLSSEYFLEHADRRDLEEQYLAVRAMDRDDGYQALSRVQKAARFMYLNKVAFNGLYRVNSKGHFNVPLGRSASNAVYDFENLELVSKFLNDNGCPSPTSNRINLLAQSYEMTLELANPGDSIYLDPPYAPLKDKPSFVSYQKEGFGQKAQVQLRDQMVELIEKGCYVVQSNAKTDLIMELYRDKKLFECEFIQVPRSLGASAASRARATEILIKGIPQ